jgi:hypothetical protein
MNMNVYFTLILIDYNIYELEKYKLYLYIYRSLYIEIIVNINIVVG